MAPPIEIGYPVFDVPGGFLSYAADLVLTLDNNSIVAHSDSENEQSLISTVTSTIISTTNVIENLMTALDVDMVNQFSFVRANQATMITAIGTLTTAVNSMNSNLTSVLNTLNSNLVLIADGIGQPTDTSPNNLIVLLKSLNVYDAGFQTSLNTITTDLALTNVYLARNEYNGAGQLRVSIV